MHQIAAFGARIAGYPIPRTKVLQDTNQKSLLRLRGVTYGSAILASAVMLGTSEQQQDFVGTGDLMIRITERGEEMPGTEVIVVGVLFEDDKFGEPVRQPGASAYYLLTLPLYSDRYAVDQAPPLLTFSSTMKAEFNQRMDEDEAFAAAYPKYVKQLTVTEFRGEPVRWGGGGERGIH